MSTSAAPNPSPAVSGHILTPAQCAQYAEQGWCILERAIPTELLQLLRAHCQESIATTDRWLDSLGVDVHGINHRGKRYFSSHPSLAMPQLFEFIRSPLMQGICRDLLGPAAFVFWEQYVVKMGESNMRFAWHQDGTYVINSAPGTTFDPYLTCWCALDDMSEANGTIYVLPYDRAGGNDLKPFRVEEGSNDLVAYEGDDPGIPVIVPAGSIALFSSHTLHRSGANVTGSPRRSYLIQYSREHVLKPDGSLWGGRGEPVIDQPV